MYTCTKKYGNDLGLSCCFRQHRAKSHCAQLHGYGLAFEFVMGAHELDENGWVFDFGGLKPLKELLTHHFDHTLAMAADDPALPQFEALADKKVVNLRVFDRVGCEAFAKMTWEMADQIVCDSSGGRAFCMFATVREHGANSATYTGRDDQGNRQ